MRGFQGEFGTGARHGSKRNRRGGVGESALSSEGIELNIGPAMPRNPPVPRSIGSYLAEIERWRWWRTYNVLRVAIASSAGFAAIVGIIVKSVSG